MKRVNIILQNSPVSSSFKRQSVCTQSKEKLLMIPVITNHTDHVMHMYTLELLGSYVIVISQYCDTFDTCVTFMMWDVPSLSYTVNFHNWSQ